jgi:pimeloyl-ACP methyl ester carboxylesterase
MESQVLDTRLGPVACHSSGQGSPIVFFAGAMANGELWRDVVAALDAHHRCITVDLPLGAHPQPLNADADRSAVSLARLLLDCLELLDVEDATVVANDTAGGLLLLALATDHPALARIGRLVLTNCDCYDQFPPDALRRGAALCRSHPRVARAGVRLQMRFPRKLVASVTARGSAPPSFFAHPAGADDLVAALAGFEPHLLLDGVDALRRFDRPVLIVWGEACEFFPLAYAERLAADFPHATLITVPGAKTWVPLDAPDAVIDALTRTTRSPTARPERRKTSPGTVPRTGTPSS